MVLKKRILVFFTTTFLATNCYSQINSYWQTLFHSAFENSKKVNDIKLEYNSILITKKQFDYQWYPKIQLNVQGTTNFTRGDSFYILNQTSDSELTQLISPYVNMSIYQKLPGQGSINLSTGYGFNYLPERNVFLQWPQLNLSFNQFLGKGAFGINGNPEFRLIKEQLNYSQLMYKKDLNSQFKEILLLFQKFDILCSEENYYFSLKDEYESELKTAEEKETAGLQSNLESHYAKHQLSESTNKLNEIEYEKEQLLININLLYPNFNQTDLQEQRYELQNIIETTYNSLNSDNYIIQNNIDNTIYNSILKQYLYQFQNNEVNYSPQLVISSSFSPDGNFNAYYTDWSKSFRILQETPYPINFSINIGIQQNFELPNAKKLRKEIYELNKISVEKEMEINIKSQREEIEMLKEQIQNDLLSITKIEKEIIEEQSFREKRKQLLIDNIITQDEFSQSETIFFKIYKDYITLFWNIINNQIKVIDICSNNFPLLDEFLGESYEF